MFDIVKMGGIVSAISDEMERPTDASDVESETDRSLVCRIRELIRVAFSGDNI